MTSTADPPLCPPSVSLSGVRESAASVVVSFITTYPLGEKRMAAHMKQMITNCSYAYEDGRRCVDHLSAFNSSALHTLLSLSLPSSPLLSRHHVPLPVSSYPPLFLFMCIHSQVFLRSPRHLSSSAPPPPPRGPLTGNLPPHDSTTGTYTFGHRYYCHPHFLRNFVHHLTLDSRH